MNTKTSLTTFVQKVSQKVQTFFNVSTESECDLRIKRERLKLTIHRHKEELKQIDKRKIYAKKLKERVLSLEEELEHINELLE